MPTQVCHDNATNCPSSARKKQMKSGTVNSGYEYEKIVPAYLALGFLKDQNIKSFTLELNSSSYDKFDDLIITITNMCNSMDRYAIQLKHKEKGRDVLNAAEEFVKTGRNNKGKSFNISEYLKAYQAQKKEIQDDYKFILFTNATFKNVENVQNYEVFKSEKHLKNEIFNEKGVYQLKLKSQNCNFFQKFFLYSGQKNVQEIREDIDNIFEKDFHSNKEKATCYINFFQELHKGSYSNTIVSRDSVILNLVSLLLSNYIIKPGLTPEYYEKLELIEEVIGKFDLTILSKIEPNLLKNVWKYKEPDPESLQQGREFKFLKTGAEATEDIQRKIACFLQNKPLFIRIKEDSEKIVQSVAHFLETLEDRKVKLVLVGKILNEEAFKGWNVFRSLQDLQTTREIDQTFKISLQGREPQTIKTLKEDFGLDLDKLITPNELFLFLEGDLMVGKKVKELPQPYISRNLVKMKMSYKKLDTLCKKQTTVVHCGGDSKVFKQFLQDEEVDLKIQMEDVLLLTDKPIEDKFDSLQHLKLVKNNCLEWFDCRVCPNQKTISDHQVNVLCGEPGIGKSTMMDFLTHICCCSYWVVTVSLPQICNFFEKKSNPKQILKEIVLRTTNNDISERVSEYFLRNKKLVLFLDGLNELKNNFIEDALHFIKKMEKKGYRIWIFCTKIMKSTLEEMLETAMFYTIEEVEEIEQEKYIRGRLSNAASVDQILENILSSGLEQSQVLKLPLILYILTENLKNRTEIDNWKEVLTLDHMYSIFIEGELQHNLEKAFPDDQPAALQKTVIDGFKKFCLKGYQCAALEICLEKNIFDMLSIKQDESFIQHVKENNDFWGLMHITETGTFSFRHHTFAEYFAAVWLTENFENIPIKKRSFLLKAKYDGIRRFFDRIVAKNCPLHLAVLNQDVSKVKCYVKNHVNSRDNVGRTALHLAVSTGKKHEILSKPNDVQIKDETYKKQKEILECLLLNKMDPLKEDHFLQWNSFQYADATLSLLSIEELAKKSDLQWKYLETLDQEIFTLCYYSATLGYPNLLRKTVEVKSFPTVNKQHKNRPLLHLAIEENQEEVVKLLIDSGASLIQTDHQKQTPLHRASIWGRINIARLLLDLKVPTEGKDSSWKTPLQWAAKMGHKDLVDLLIEKGADVNAKDKYGRTSLQKAAYMGKTEVVRYLIDKGADVNYPSSNQKTALLVAAEMGHSSTVKCLIDNGADKNAFDKFKRTAVHYAAYSGHKEVVSYLVEQKADIFAMDEDEKTAKEVAEDRKHYSIVEILEAAETMIPRRVSFTYTIFDPDDGPFHCAARSGNLETIKQMLDSGTSLEETNKKKKTALHIASLQGHFHIVKYLLSKGANSKASDDDGRLPLHLASQRGHFDIVKELIPRGSITAVDNWGITALHRAVYKGHLEVVKLLVDAGADINALSNETGTSLHSAALGGHNDVIDYLLSKGAMIGIRNNNEETCLHIAAQKGCTETVSYLVTKKRGIVNSVDKREKSALHWAAEKGYKGIVKVLVEAGADVNKVDNRKKTAYDIAVEGNREDIVHYLKNRTC